VRIFLDCDGVLADFDKRAKEILGCLPREFEGKEGEDQLWERLYATKEFFYSLDPLPDAFELVRGVEKLGYHPTILTGIPKPREHQLSSVPAADQKRKWVKKHLGPEYEVITCRSVNKCLHIERRGDVLIDDWQKYMTKWEDRGGKFILHSFAKDSLEQLETYLDDYWKKVDADRWVAAKFEEFQEEIHDGLMHSG
jgi:hypothetical protein